MYEVTGMIVFWVLRVGLLVLLLMFIQGCRIDRQNYSCTVPTKNNTWKIVPMSWRSYLKNIKPLIVVFFIVLLLDIVCWLTLFI